MTFKDGNVVQVIGPHRNPYMTVEDVRPAYQRDYHMVDCVWFDEQNRLCRGTFQSRVLQLIRE